MTTSTTISKRIPTPPSLAITQSTTLKQPEKVQTIKTLAAQFSQLQNNTYTQPATPLRQVQIKEKIEEPQDPTQDFIHFFTVKTTCKQSVDLDSEHKEVLINWFMDIKKVTNGALPKETISYLNFCWAAISKTLQEENFFVPGKIQNAQHLRDILEIEKIKFLNFIEIIQNTDSETQKQHPDIQKLLSQEHIKTDSNGKYLATKEGFPLLFTLSGFLDATMGFHQKFIPLLINKLPPVLAQDDVFKNEIFKDLHIAFEYFLQNSDPELLKACFKGVYNSHNLLLSAFAIFLIEKKINVVYLNLYLLNNTQSRVKIQELLNESSKNIPKEPSLSQEINQKISMIKNEILSVFSQEELLRQELLEEERKKALKMLPMKKELEALKTKIKAAFLQKIKAKTPQLKKEESESRKQIEKTMEKETQILLTTLKNEAKQIKKQVDLKNIQSTANECSLRQKLKNLYSQQIETITQRESLLKQQLQELADLKKTLTKQCNDSEHNSVTSKQQIDNSSQTEPTNLLPDALDSENIFKRQLVTEFKASSLWRHNPYDSLSQKTTTSK